jgi:hypothetical protein
MGIGQAALAVEGLSNCLVGEWYTGVERFDQETRAGAYSEYPRVIPLLLAEERDDGQTPQTVLLVWM